MKATFFVFLLAVGFALALPGEALAQYELDDSSLANTSGDPTDPERGRAMQESQIDTDTVVARRAAPFARHRVWFEILRTQVRNLVRFTPAGAR